MEHVLLVVASVAVASLIVLKSRAFHIPLTPARIGCTLSVAVHPASHKTSGETNSWPRGPTSPVAQADGTPTRPGSHGGDAQRRRVERSSAERAFVIWFVPWFL